MIQLFGQWVLADHWNSWGANVRLIQDQIDRKVR